MRAATPLAIALTLSTLSGTASADIMQGTPLSLSVTSASGVANMTVEWAQMTSVSPAAGLGWAPTSTYTSLSPQEIRTTGGLLLGTLRSLHVEYGNVVEGDFSPPGYGGHIGRTANLDFVFESALDVTVTFASATTNTFALGSQSLPMGWGPYDASDIHGWPPWLWMPQARESASVAFTDLNGDGVLATGTLPGGTMLDPYLHVPGAVRYNPLLAGPFVAGAWGTAGASVNTTLDVQNNSGLFQTYLINAMDVQGGFNIGAGDLAEYHSLTTVIPGPGSLTLLAAGLLGLARRR